MHRKQTTAEDGVQRARSVSQSRKTLRRHLSFRPVAVLAAACAAFLTGGLAAGAIGAGTAGAVVISPHATATTSGTYVPLTPARISDTRAASGFPNAGATLTACGTEKVVVEGAGGVPTTGVSAVVLNVAATNVTAAGFLTVFPDGATQPTVANLNTTAGNTVSNLVTVGVGTDGDISIFNHAGSTDVVVDVEGYYTTAVGTTGLYDAVTPNRVLGTLAAGAPIAAGTSTAVTVTGGSTGVPADAKAVVFNLTASAGTAASFLTAYPAGGNQPTAANLNFGANQIIGNRVTVPVGTGGQVEIFNHSGTVNVDADLNGYYTGSGAETGASFVPITPTRLVDTRTSTGGTTIAQNTTENFSFAADSAIPAAATALASNITVVAGNAPGFLTVYPSTVATPPTAADVNWTAGGIVPNFTVAPLNSSTVNLFNNNGGPVNVVIDAFGYFAPVTIPTFAVTPAAAQTPSFSTITTPTAGSVTYTATGFTAGQLVNIALFPSLATGGAPTISTTTGAPTFLPNGSGNASGQGTTNVAPVLGACITGATCSGYISSVNGVPALTAATTATGVAADASGSVTFSVNSNKIDGTVPVVFTGPSTTLAVNANGTPATGFEVGIAGSSTWGPPTPNATSGTYTGYLVQTVNNAAQTFTACNTPGPTFLASSCNTFSYATANANTFAYYEPNAAGSTTLSGANFNSWLSGEVPAYDATGVIVAPGDALNITYSTIGPSQFAFVGPAGPGFTPAPNANGDVPASPTAVTTAVNGAGNVVVTWTAPSNPDVLSYTVLRSSVPTSGIPSIPVAVTAPGHTYSTTGVPATLPGGGVGMLGAGAVPAPVTFTDTSATPGTTYIYFVVATADAPNNGSTSAPSLPSAQITPPVSATASFAPLSTSTGFALGNTSDTAGALQAGDTFTVGFNGPVTINSAAFSLTVTDGANTAVLTPANATLTQGASSSSVVYTVSANSIPGTPAPIHFVSGTNPLEVVAQSGVSNSVGQWNIPGSLALNGTVYTNTFGGAKTLVATAAPTPGLTQVTAPLGAQTVTVTNTTAGDAVTVTDQNGNVIASGAGTATTTTLPTSVTINAQSVLIATQQVPGGYLSQSGVSVGWSVVPIATTGSLAAGTAVHLTASTLPLLSVTFNATLTGAANGTFLVNGVAPVGGPPLTTTQSASSTGQFAVTFTAGSVTTGGVANTLTATNGTANTQDADSYTTGP